MKISLDELTAQPLLIRRDFPAGAYGGEIVLLGPVSLKVELRRSGPKVYARGSVRTTAELTCCRCLEKFPYNIDADIDLMYQPGCGEEEQNELLSRDDLKTVRYSEPELDLGEDARQAIHLAVPFKPLCGENCQGLCPRCGSNLNSGNCGCVERAVETRFPELRKLMPRSDSGAEEKKEERSRRNGEP